ncbi:TPA: hypothetical protein N0F65_002118 [Lagenidium giganteum]|uniref:Uncharacterized protein n=1 Tax=Lagenidium giganteum TaxID=4803 RepID=A0AAV2ZDK9_9STRA|nr:TPA: hypothetical protein N0F65_002118 [Lagenidium giganteum]
MDDLVIGFMSLECPNSFRSSLLNMLNHTLEAYRLQLVAMSSEDNRRLPVESNLECSFHSTQLSVLSSDGQLLILDPVAEHVVVIQLDVTVRSESYRIRHSESLQRASRDALGSSKRDTTLNHVVWSFYHLYEKFPVRGLLEGSAGEGEATTKLTVARALNAQDSASAVTVDVRTLVQHFMNELRKLHKPLGALNVSEALNVEICNVK